MKHVWGSKARWLTVATMAGIVTFAISIYTPGLIEWGGGAIAIAPPGPSSTDRISIIPAGGTPMEAPPISTAPACQSASPSGPLGTLRTRLGLHWWRLFLPATVYARGSEDDHAGGRGDVHLERFNGARYDFQGVGEFFLVNARSGGFVVQGRQQPYGDSKQVAVTTAVAMNVGGDIVGVYANQTAPLRINHRPVSPESPIIHLPAGGEVRREGNGLLTVWPSGSQVRVLFGSYLDYDVTVCPADQNSIQGILGEPNSPADTFRARNGDEVRFSEPQGSTWHHGLYDVFGNSWRIGQRESLFDYAAGQTTKTFTDLNFPYDEDPPARFTPEQRTNAEAACRQAGITDAGPLADCIYDVAATGEVGFAANDALSEAIYAKTHSRPAEGDSLRCEGQEDQRWDCTIRHLLGGRPGTMMTIQVETLQSGQNATESMSCGPISNAAEAHCADRLQGMIFQGARIVETLTTTSGERWEHRRPINCGKEEGQPCG